MNRLLQPFLAGVLFCFSNLAIANDKGPKAEVQPAWATAVDVDYVTTTMDDQAEDGYADLHYECQVSLAQKAVFYRKAFRILSEAGVENLSQVSINYDPSFQTLFFNSIQILRDGKRINQLALPRIKTIQQEKELNRHIYDGSLTAMLILEDLRKGDVLEYSYTLKGFNPIYQNKYTNIFTTQFSVPFYGLYYRVMVPAGRSLTIANSLTDIKPRISNTGTETGYEWSIKNTMALQVEDNLPSWYDAFPMIMVSEYKSWKEVNDWALSLYPFTVRLSDGLQKKIDEIKSSHAAADARLLAALRFVQDDLRYMGIEMGESSHKPHDPSLVFAQRFGDCKDKAYLLCTMLRSMGIEANPV
ncbi:MAG TPA: DUF3857 domain-containing protein, partial [Flavisolibacter sp.]|nr:DUF3857 domain-containing protein [Flavisolibacter sp.]